MENRIQFSIRSVLILLAVAAVGFGWLFPVIFPKPIPHLQFGGGRAMFHSVGGRSHATDYEATLTPDTFDAVPPWFRRTKNPPVSASDAMLIAQQYYQHNLSGEQYFDGLVIDSADLRLFDYEDGHWYWRVSFVSHGAGGFQPSIDLAVLMDGSVVEPTAAERTDLGWPLPNAEAPARPEGLTDDEIVRKFVTELNPKRTYIGQTVDLVGRLSRIPAGHAHERTYCGLHLVLSDGTLLVVKSHRELIPELGVERKIRAQLIGLRSYSDSGPVWDGLTLYPGVRW